MLETSIFPEIVTLVKAEDSPSSGKKLLNQTGFTKYDSLKSPLAFTQVIVLHTGELGSNYFFFYSRFYDRRDAEEALDSLDGRMLDGRELRVQMARYGRPSSPYRSRRRRYILLNLQHPNTSWLKYS